MPNPWICVRACSTHACMCAYKYMTSGPSNSRFRFGANQLTFNPARSGTQCSAEPTQTRMARAQYAVVSSLRRPRALRRRRRRRRYERPARQTSNEAMRGRHDRRALAARLAPKHVARPGLVRLPRLRAPSPRALPYRLAARCPRRQMVRRRDRVKQLPPAGAAVREDPGAPAHIFSLKRLFAQYH